MRVFVPVGFAKPLTRARENPCPYVRVQVYAGAGAGGPGKPQGGPCHSLAVQIPLAGEYYGFQKVEGSNTHT